MFFDRRLKIDLLVVLVFFIINILDFFGLVLLISVDCYVLFFMVRIKFFFY